jgi:hypothetical protein
MPATSRNTPQRHARANQDQLKLSGIAWAGVIALICAQASGGGEDDACEGAAANMAETRATAHAAATINFLTIAALFLTLI